MKRIVSVILLVVLLAVACMPAFAAAQYKSSGKTNIRTGPGLGYASIGVVPKGATITVTKTQKDNRGVWWGYTTYNNKSGWVSSVYYNNPSSSSKKVTATGGSTNIRSSASLNGKKLTVMPQGAVATYLGSAKKDNRGVYWYKVKYNGVTGWVSSKYTKKG